MLELTSPDVCLTGREWLLATTGVDKGLAAVRLGDLGFGCRTFRSDEGDVSLGELRCSNTFVGCSIIELLTTSDSLEKLFCDVGLWVEMSEIAESLVSSPKIL